LNQIKGIVLHKNKTLRPIYFVVLSTFFINVSLAQTIPNISPAYERIPNLPPFKLYLAPDSISFLKEDLKKRKETIIMVFSPDCEHCLHATKDLIEHINLFKKVQIVMASSLGFQHVKKFFQDFKIADYANIKVGWDNTYFLGTFYEVKAYPAIFLYDKKGKFKQAFDANANWETIAASL
jgi:thioredoxin-related protein